eukprot:TRINITY_DN6188_c1_g1_i3.p1 TRINITY_DN6188_c1_g1~~TRINITY_DN6188_c1_g1_i3.p1  ORF type:complete len:108 (+),score=7.01 TRINITY_DN6188_c1_g1_i3:153-476(+)
MLDMYGLYHNTLLFADSTCQSLRTYLWCTRCSLNARFLNLFLNRHLVIVYLNTFTPQSMLGELRYHTGEPIVIAVEMEEEIRKSEEPETVVDAKASALLETPTRVNN